MWGFLIDQALDGTRRPVRQRYLVRPAHIPQCGECVALIPQMARGVHLFFFVTTWGKGNDGGH